MYAFFIIFKVLIDLFHNVVNEEIFAMDYSKHGENFYILFKKNISKYNGIHFTFDLNFRVDLSITSMKVIDIKETYILNTTQDG